ncbi:MAG: BLUF domain-containing protein [Bryobacteraceae bacterium]|jgi:hypothetical protein
MRKCAVTYLGAARRSKEIAPLADKVYMSAIDGASNDLGYLTYFSSAVERFNQSGLKRLLEISRRNNEPRGITGLLLYRDGHFLQYLEGPQDAVSTTYAHITMDGRHHSARLVGTGRLAGRIFPEWWMGYRSLAGIRAANTEGYSECLQPSFKPSDRADPAEQLAELFRDLMARL